MKVLELGFTVSMSELGFYGLVLRFRAVGHRLVQV